MKITKAETIARLRALPLDEPFVTEKCCPVEMLYHGVAIGDGWMQVGDGERSETPWWLVQFIDWADGKESPRWYGQFTPRECLEALGAEP